MGQYRILLVDDHQLIIDGIKGFLEQSEIYQVVGEANSGIDAIRLADVLSPDLILMDIEMPGMSGMQACEEIKRKYPAIKIIIVSMHKEKHLVKKLIEKGADGYLLKTSEKEEVLGAMQKVMEGKSVFSQDVTLSLLGNDEPSLNSGSSLPAFTQLTEREVEILRNIANGLTNKEIGDQLNISHRTVDTHRTNLMKKLDVKNVAGLIKIAFQEGLIQ